MKTYVIYNKKSNNGSGAEGAFRVKELWKGKELIYKEVNEFSSFKELFDFFEADDEVVICGGDGTLNFLVNDVDCESIQNKIYYYPTGTGNDFWNDLGKTPDDEPAIINEYLVKLPTVTVNGIRRKFINGIGYGIDGYCCEVGDKLKANGDGKPINYTSIAIKGLLFYYRPTSAKVTADGREYSFKKVWLAPTMNGRFYGGGMMAAPNQDRLNKESTVTTMVMYGAGKIKTLAAFPTIFKGEHVKKTKLVSILKCKDVKVEFDRPVALQIDGETVLGVTEYSVETYKA